MKRTLSAAICGLFVTIATSAIAPPAQADPSYSAQEQALMDELMHKCNDMPNEPTIHARAAKVLEIIQRDGAPLGPTESETTVEKFVRDSIPDGVGPQKCVDLMGIYAQERSDGAITAP